MSQTDKLYELLKDHEPHRTVDLVPLVYPSSDICPHCGRGDRRDLARLGARKFDAEKKYDVTIKSFRKDKHWWYQMERPRRIVEPYPVDDSTMTVEIPTPPNWKCPRPNCAIEVKHTHTTFTTLPPAFEKKAGETQRLFA